MTDLVRRLRERHSFLCDEAAAELDRLNAQALELCAEISRLTRERDLADSMLHSLQTRWANRATEQELRGLLREARHDLYGWASVHAGEAVDVTAPLIFRIDAALAGTADQPASRPYAVCELLSDARESVFQDIERMRESGVYEPDLGATIALLHNIDTFMADRATDQAANCPTCGRSTKRHPGYVIGNHWLESAYERICAGEAEDDVLRDYDVFRVATPFVDDPEAK